MSNPLSSVTSDTLDDIQEFKLEKFNCDLEKLTITAEKENEIEIKDDYDQNDFTEYAKKYSHVKIFITNEYKYIGEINTISQRHGFGICQYSNGDLYVGQFLDDKRQGIGRLTYTNGDIYQGEFLKDTINGFMECLSKNTSMQGLAKDYKFHSEIVFQSKLNSIEGNFHNGTGTGKIYDNDKKYTYEGEIQYNKQEGYGISQINEKYIYKGNHSKCRFHGYGELYYPNGQRFFGIFENNLRKGLGICYYIDGIVDLGKYIDDVKHGPFLVCLNKNTFRVEMFNYGFKYKVIEKIETAKNYLKVYYPEFNWLFKLNFKGVSEIFNNVKTEEFLEVNCIVNENILKPEISSTTISTHDRLKEVLLRKVRVEKRNILSQKDEKKIVKQSTSESIKEIMN